VATIVHPVFVVAAGLLAAGLLAWNGTLLRLAAGLFLPAAALLVVVVGGALLRTPARGATIAVLRLAVAGLR